MVPYLLLLLSTYLTLSLANLQLHIGSKTLDKTSGKNYVQKIPS